MFPNIYYNYFPYSCLSELGYRDLYNYDAKVISKYEQVNSKYHHIKQRSKEWFDLRKISGSMILGLLGMKHSKVIDKYGINPTLRDDEAHKTLITNLQKNITYISIPSNVMMRYGEVHEALGVATILTNHPGTYYETGTWALDYKGMTLTSSNDGVFVPNKTLLEDYQTNVFPVEIKTKTQFINFDELKWINASAYITIPTYYIPQLVLEMAAMNLNYVMFVSVGEFLTNIFYVKRNEKRENNMLELIYNIYKRCVLSKENIDAVYNEMFNSAQFDEFMRDISNDYGVNQQVKTVEGWRHAPKLLKKIN